MKIFQKHIVVAVALLGLAPSAIKAGIYRVQSWQDPKTSRIVTFYYDRHELGTRTENQEQFRIIERAIEKLLKEDKTLVILVEAPGHYVTADGILLEEGKHMPFLRDAQGNITKFVDYAKLWAYRCSIFRPIPCLIGQVLIKEHTMKSPPSVTLQSIDPREPLNSLRDMLALAQKGKYLPGRRAQLKKVFDILPMVRAKHTERLTESEQGMYDVIEPKVMADYQKLQNLIGKQDITQELQGPTILKQLGPKAGDIAKWFSAPALSSALDLDLFYNIVKPSSPQNIAAFVGGSHAKAVAGYLKQIGWTKIFDDGYDYTATATLPTHIDEKLLYGQKTEYNEELKNRVNEAIAITLDPPKDLTQYKRSVQTLMNITRKQAQNGSPEAMVRLAKYLEERGEEKAALDWLNRAAEQNFGPAFTELGKQEEPGGEKQLELFNRAIELGDAKAALAKGDAYYNKYIAFPQLRTIGQQEEFLLNQAIGAYKQAFELDRKNRLGHTSLGNLFVTAAGREASLSDRDPEYMRIKYKNAAKYIKQAAQKGNPLAQLSLALFYKQGIGIEKNPLKALRWAHKAKEQGLLAASTLIASIHKDQDHIRDIAQKRIAKAFKEGRKAREALLTETLEGIASGEGKAGKQAFEIGRRYQQGRGVKKDLLEAIRWYELAAEQEVPQAMVALAKLVETQDRDRSIDLYHKAAELGSGEALSALGHIAESNKNYKEALTLYTRALNSGFKKARKFAAGILIYGPKELKNYKEAGYLFTEDIEDESTRNAYSLRQLASLYMTGLGVPKLPSEAIDLWKEAAEMKDAKAMFNLGFAYYQGKEIPRDLKESAKWLSSAVDLNYVPAFYYYGQLFEHGLGVDKSLREALRLYGHAAKKGVRQAQEAYDRLSLWMNITQEVPQPKRSLVRPTKQKEVTRKSTAPRQRIARVKGLGRQRFETGKRFFVQGDFIQAAKWFEKAVALNNVDAMLYLAVIRHKDDIDQAIALFSKAAELGSGAAMYNLGVHAENEKNLEKALSWYIKAKNAGYEKAITKIEELEQAFN